MRVGILGGGQLGRMLGLAAHNLGVPVRFLDRTADAVAGQVGELCVGACEDPASLERFAAGVDLITYEFENVPVETVRFFQGIAPVYPPAAALEASQDRVIEKRFFREQGIPTAEFCEVYTRDELDRGLERVGLPAILKTRRLGYDGKGQVRIETRADAAAAWAALHGQPLIVEGCVPFERELSIVAVRSRSGETAFYPLVENHHAGGILRRTIAPAAGVDAQTQALAQRKAGRVLEALGYVGVLAIEFFALGGRLYANEMAPRVHNSGHWTIDAAETSQFENHLRAILGWPLGPTSARCPSVMLNIIGQAPPAADVLALPGAKLHLYGKMPRPGRKLGHVTVLGATGEEARRRAERVSALLPV